MKIAIDSVALKIRGAQHIVCERILYYGGDILRIHALQQYCRYHQMAIKKAGPKPRLKICDNLCHVIVFLAYFASIVYTPAKIKNQIINDT